MKKATLKATGDRVIATRLAKAEKTTGGLIIPDNAENKTARAKVFDPGKNEEMKGGDIIIFHADSGVDVVDQNDDKYIILDTDDILAVEI